MAMMHFTALASVGTAIEALMDSLGSEIVIAIAVVLVLLLAAALITIGTFLSTVARKRRNGDSAEDDTDTPAPAQPTVAADDGALVAAITAAVSAYLAAEAAETGREAPAFRVVSFRRSWNGRAR